MAIAVLLVQDEEWARPEVFQLNGNLAALACQLLRKVLKTRYLNMAKERKPRLPIKQTPDNIQIKHNPTHASGT